MTDMVNLMKRIVLAAGAALVLIGPTISAFAQGSSHATLFFFDAISYAAEHKGKSRIDFYVQVPYEELRFVKEGEGYVARYDVTLVLENPEEKLLQDRSWSVDVSVKEFAQTISRKLYSLAYQSLEVAPGNYRVALTVRDNDSKVGGKLTRNMLVTDYSKGTVALSDIMIVSRLTTTAEGKNRIVPNISGNVGTEGEGFFLYFEDAEFTLRTLAAGFPIRYLPSPSALHKVSASTSRLGSPLLLRYHMRNALLLNSIHGPWWVRLLLPIWAIFSMVKQLVKIPLLPSRRAQSQAIAAGIIDFYANRFGKITPSVSPRH